MSKSTVRIVMMLAGAALVIGFFLPWIDVGFATVSGLTVARQADSGALVSLFLFAIPIGGAAMVFTAATHSKYARAVSAVTGITLLGYGVIKTVHTFFAVSGLGLWLVIAAAFAALAAPFLVDRAG